MKGLIAGVWLIVILLACYFSLKAIPQTDNQSVVIEVPQTIAVEEQLPMPVESPTEDEPIQVDTNDKDIGTSPGVNELYPFPDKWTEEFTPDVLSVDYRTGYVKGYNDGCRGYDSWPKNVSSPNSLAGYTKGYSVGYAEWSRIEHDKYLREKYAPR